MSQEITQIDALECFLVTWNIYDVLKVKTKQGGSLQENWI